MAVPQLLQMGMRPAPPVAGMLRASPILPTFMVRGPLGTFGCHAPPPPPPIGDAAGADPGLQAKPVSTN